MNDMRTLGNLIIEFMKAAHNDDLQGEDLLNRENFDYLTKAIQQMTHTETGALKHVLKLATGYLLKKVIKVMKGCYIQEGKLKRRGGQIFCTAGTRMGIHLLWCTTHV